VNGDLFSWADGATLRDTGMAVASEAQEREAPGWTDRAYAALYSVARQRPEVFVDDVLAIFREQPQHPNAWGGVWRRAIADGVISRTGRVRETQDRRKHRHQYPVYRSEIFGDGQ
jgi:hypothetical protein